jgi:hypothetical protein
MKGTNLFRKSSRKWRGVDFMGLVPEKTCGWAPGDMPGQIILLQPRFSKGLLGRFLQPRLKETKKYIRIPLEIRGSFLWGLIDGKMTASDMAEAFRTEFPAEADQVPERVATYLYQMVDNGLISFVNFKG